MTRRRRQLVNTAEDLRQPRDLDNVTHFEPRRETVGDLLRRAREGKGQALEAVATKLRIRLGYLKAIEAGKYQDLPGLTYAVGFVRTYADHLGLDAEDVVRRFRDEVTELKGQTQLIFPVVAAEGKMPRGAILLLSAFLAAIAYGGWYYLSEREQSALDLIPELPAKLKALVTGEETAPETAADAAPAAETNPAGQTATPGVAAPAPVTGEAPAPAGETAPAADAAVEPVPVPATDEPADSSVAESAAAASALPAAPTEPAPVDDTAATAALMSQTPSPAAPAAPTVAAPETSPAAPSAAAPLPVTPAAPEIAPPAAPSLDASGLPTVPAPTPAAPSATTFAGIAPATEAPGLPPLADGQAFGATEGPSRIVLVARLESWIQVTDPETNALLSRVLRAGDRYYVPDEAGLTLATGNAGGLDIWVDGRRAAALGPVGVVRRGVALDPQRLVDGTALPE